MIMKIFIFSLLLFLALPLPRVSATEDIKIGTAVEVIGLVIRTSGTTSERLMENQAVYLNDEINTGKNGVVKILFKDQTVLRLGPHSRIRMNKFQSGEKSSNVFELVYGRMRSIFVKDTNTTINTPKISVGIRGTEVLLDVVKVMKKSGVAETLCRVGILRGAVEVMAGKRTYQVGSKECYDSFYGQVRALSGGELRSLSVSQNKFLADVRPVSSGKFIYENPTFDRLKAQNNLPDVAVEAPVEYQGPAATKAGATTQGQPAAGPSSAPAAPASGPQGIKQKVENYLKKGMERNE
jgi:hypothetical protein